MNLKYFCTKHSVKRVYCPLLLMLIITMSLTAISASAESTKQILESYDPRGVRFVESIKKNINPLFGSPWEGQDYSKYPGLTWSDEQPRVLKAIDFPPADCLLKGRFEIDGLPGLESIRIRFLDPVSYSDSSDGSRGRAIRITNLPDLISLHIGWKLLRGKAMDLQNLTTLPNLRELDLSHGLYSREDYQYLRGLKKLEILNLEGSTFKYFDILSDLPNLKKLFAQYCGHDEKGETRAPLRIQGLNSPSLTDLNLKINGIEEIEGLDNLPNLENLDLSRNIISRIAGLEKLAVLKNLDLSQNKISRIEGLNSLTRLESLNLNLNPIHDVEQFYSPTLKQLKLGPLQSLESLDNLAGLECLSLDYSGIDDFNGFKRITNLSGIEKLNSLKSLKVSFTPISHLKELSNLTELNHLEIINGHVSSLDDIGGLKKLTYLNVINNKISDISPLKNLINLEHLNISGNKVISGFTVLKDLPELIKLDVIGLNLTDMSVIAGLNNLVELDVSHNKLSNLAGFKNFSRLKVLSISDRTLSDISGLAEGAPLLEELNISNTWNLTDLSPAKKLKHLTRLKCRSSVGGVLDLSNWPEMEDLDLENNKIANITGWDKLSSTAKIVISGNRLPLSLLYQLRQDEIKTGRQWEFTYPQDDIWGEIKLKKNQPFDLSREWEIGGHKTQFYVYDISNKHRPFPVKAKDYVLGPDEKKQIIFKRTGKFKLVMANEALPVSKLKGLLFYYRKAETLRAGSGEIIVE